MSKKIPVINLTVLAMAITFQFLNPQKSVAPACERASAQREVTLKEGSGKTIEFRKQIGKVSRQD